MRVTFSIPDNVVEHLNQISGETGVAKSRIVARLVEDHWEYRKEGYYAGYSPANFPVPDGKNSDAE